MIEITKDDLKYLVAGIYKREDESKATKDTATEKSDGLMSAADKSKLNKALTEHQDISGKLNVSDKGVANGVATLDANGVVPSSQLPSYVDDVLEYANKDSLPKTGEAGKIYVTTNDNLTYRWSGTAYVEISKSLAVGTVEGTAFDGKKGKDLEDNFKTIATTYETKADAKTKADATVAKINSMEAKLKQYEGEEITTSDIDTMFEDSISAIVFKSDGRPWGTPNTQVEITPDNISNFMDCSFKQFFSIYSAKKTDIKVTYTMYGEPFNSTEISYVNDTMEVKVFSKNFNMYMTFYFTYDSSNKMFNSYFTS